MGRSLANPDFAGLVIKHMKKLLTSLIFAAWLLTLAGPVLAVDEVSEASSDLEEVTAEDLGATASQINGATQEATETITETGTLIEIGNTTAEETTVIVRVTAEDGTTEDNTVEIETAQVDLETAEGTESDLNDWIAGDQLTYQATENTNSGSIDATKIKNRSLSRSQRGKNGWITAIRPAEQKIDVTWQGATYTLNLTSAKIVAGVKNPATINDLKVGDRIRGRVVEDNDGNAKTWDAKIVVVLRRGNTLFMRVTRWVVPGKIVEMDENPTVPTTILMEISESKFYQKGDVNNLVGAPGEQKEVYIDENTKLRRRYFGRSLIGEFSEGDIIQVIGRLNETTGKLEAQFIRDTNIQVLGVARRIGVVKAIDLAKGQISATVAATSVAWQVNVGSDTKIYKQGKEATLADVAIGDKIRVLGTANRRLNLVAAKKIVILRDK